MTSASVSELCGYTPLPEPDLVFSGGQTHKHPLVGLSHRPYGLKFGAPRSVRLAFLANPANGKLKSSSRAQEARQPPGSRELLPRVSGF